ncbi:MAG: type II toxin-antitoxin system RelE/ParE family toxin [Alphaproteobacteria bacterium]|nr:MAG: type II toxin-antitoxin system RelE/ParE family toxin [Alphaproteobacteria bacterium]
MSYRLSGKAEDDIIDIYLQGIALFGAQQAERYHHEMADIFRFLSNEPMAARERLEIDPPVRVHPYGAHIIIYIVEPSGDILILRVRHAREDWQDRPV